MNSMPEYTIEQLRGIAASVRRAADALGAVCATMQARERQLHEAVEVARSAWLEENPAEDGHDAVTPFDHLFYGMAVQPQAPAQGWRDGGEGYWNEEHEVYTAPIDIGDWGARIECHGPNPTEAGALRAAILSLSPHVVATLSVQDDAEKWREHSVILNRFCWQLSEALGDVASSTTAEATVDMDVLLTRAVARIKSVAAEPPAQQATWVDERMVGRIHAYIAAKGGYTNGRLRDALQHEAALSAQPTKRQAAGVTDAVVNTAWATYVHSMSPRERYTEAYKIIAMREALLAVWPVAAEPVSHADAPTCRTRFERWMTEEMGYPPGDLIWQEKRNCYANYGMHLAWKAWQESTYRASPEQPAERQGEPFGYIGSRELLVMSKLGHTQVIDKKLPELDITTPLYLHPAAPVGVPDDNSASVAAIQFALSGEDGLAFLRCWNEGDFDACRREWPEAPVECYIGADPLAAAPPAPQENPHG